MKKDSFKIAVALSSIMQAGLSVFVPPLLLSLGAKFLIEKFGLSDKIFIFAIIFGVICGFYNMFKYIYSVLNSGGK